VEWSKKRPVKGMHNDMDMTRLMRFHWGQMQVLYRFMFSELRSLTADSAMCFSAILLPFHLWVPHRRVLTFRESAGEHLHHHPGTQQRKHCSGALITSECHR
jgi:hypothetical protein